MDLKDPENSDIWITLAKYYILPKLYNLHNNLNYLKQYSIIKTEHPQIQFYYDEIITYLHNNKETITLKQDVKQIYKHILKSEYKNRSLIGQYIWNHCEKHVPWGKKNGRILLFFTVYQKIIIFFTKCCTLQLEQMNTSTDEQIKDTLRYLFVITVNNLKIQHISLYTTKKQSKNGNSSINSTSNSTKQITHHSNI